MLTIEHLTKQFGEKTLFRDLCLTVEGPAVLWAPSGWGKTTLLRILMGLEEPTSGIVQGVGRVAAVFQEDRLCPQLTAVQNVTLVLPGSAEQYKEQIIKDFQQLGMDAAALALPAARLSGGQKRRTALLRALWAASDTLLLDEPFTGMDPDTLAAAAALLRERCGEKPVLLALGICWKSGVAAEVIGLPNGSIGDALYRAKITLSTGELFAWTFVIILLSAGFEKLFLLLLDCVTRAVTGEVPQC